MHADVVAHPNAVVVEIVGAPVAPLAVLRVLQHMRIAYVAVELIVSWVEVDLGEFVLFGHSGQPFQSDRWVCGVALGDNHRRNNHHEIGKQVETEDDATENLIAIRYAAFISLQDRDS